MLHTFYSWSLSTNFWQKPAVHGFRSFFANDDSVGHDEIEIVPKRHDLSVQNPFP